MNKKNKIRIAGTHKKKPQVANLTALTWGEFKNT